MRSHLSGALQELRAFFRGHQPGHGRQLSPGNLAGHVWRQHHRPIGELAVEQNDWMVYTQHIGHILGLDPNKKLGVSGPNNGCLGLNAKTPLLEILELLNQKPGLARYQGNQALPRLFRRLVQVFRNFQDGVCRHTDATIIQESDFQFARFLCLPLVAEINRVACFCSHLGALTLDIDGSHNHICFSDRFVSPPDRRRP